MMPRLSFSIEAAAIIRQWLQQRSNERKHRLRTSKKGQEGVGLNGDQDDQHVTGGGSCSTSRHGAFRQYRLALSECLIVSRTEKTAQNVFFHEPFGMCGNRGDKQYI